MGSGVDKREVQASTCDVLLEEIHARDAIVRTPEGLDLMPGNTDLTAAEIELMDEDGREQRLKRALDPLRPDYDFIILDCPPALSLLTLNARSEEHTSELQSLMRISYAVFCLKNNNKI